MEEEHSKSKRKDGRALFEARKTFVRETVSTNNNASKCYLEWGRNKVLASVFGPMQNAQHLNKDEGLLNFELRYCESADPGRHFGIPHIEREKSVSSMTEFVKGSIKPVIDFSAFPDSLVECDAFVIEADGNEISAVIFALTSALRSAGIPMLDTISCQRTVVINGELLLDPSQEEEKEAEAILTLSFAGNLKKLTNVCFIGFSFKKILFDALKKTVSAAVVAIKDINEKMKLKAINELENREENK